MNPTLESSIISAGVALLVVLIGQLLVPIIRERHALSRDARYLAIRIVCVLDKYLEDCASTAIDSGQEDENGNSIAQVSAPLAPTYPSDVNWKSINDTMMYKILALPAAADRAANYVSGADENSFPPDFSEYFEARSQQYSVLGLQAHELTVELRKKYGIQEIQNRSWDPVQHLKDALKEIEDRHKKNAAAWEEIRPTLPSPPAA
jgi:hypothetical protein